MDENSLDLHFSNEEIDLIIEELKDKEWIKISTLVIEKIKAKITKLDEDNVKELHKTYHTNPLKYDELLKEGREEIEAHFNLIVTVGINILSSKHL